MNRFKLYIFVVLSVSLLAVSCQGSDLEKMKTINQEKLPDEISREVKLTYSDSGVVKRIMQAPLIHIYKTDTSYTEFPEGVLVQFFDKKGKMVTELDCGYGLTRGGNEDLIFRDNVVIKNIKNKNVLMSDEIYLKDSTFYSDSTVYILNPSVSMRGSSLVAPRDFSSYKLRNPVGVVRSEAFDKNLKKQ